MKSKLSVLAIALAGVFPLAQTAQAQTTAELKQEMIRGGVQSLRMAGIQKILEGMTTPEEILRTTVDD